MSKFPHLNCAQTKCDREKLALLRYCIHMYFLNHSNKFSCFNLIFPESSDNGPHYHNSAVELYLAEVSGSFSITLKEHVYFEAGEGKTVLDTHFAHISHKIIRWVRVGNDLERGEQIADMIQVVFQVL